jgi:hypothetical protein
VVYHDMGYSQSRGLLLAAGGASAVVESGAFDALRALRTPAI